MLRKNVQFVATMVILGWLGDSAPAVADEMRISDLPIPTGATDITYLKRRGDVRFQVPSDFRTIGNYYAKQLAELRWARSGRDNLQSSFEVRKYSKGQATLEVRVSGTDGGCEVRLTPKGMMWEEDDQPTPKDLPLPDDAMDVAYDDFFERIKFKSASDVSTVAEFLSRELEQRKWTKTATEVDVATFVRMTFTQQKSSLTVDIRGDDSASEVTIRTKGMQWDGMKAEIARAKEEQEAAQVAAEALMKQKAAEEPLSLPKRREKPRQGIDQLEKLPNEAIVVMDGVTFKLQHVLAYEVYDYGEWMTKIIATQKPVKQNSLLAKLRQTGTDRDENDFPQSWPEPYLEVVLDEDDLPRRLNLRAGETPGNGSGDELTGTALVEDGRARGTVELKEPGEFFDKVYTATISFDVSVLTRDSTPMKRLTNAPRLVNSGKLTIGNTTYNLANVVGYPMNRFDEPMTSIVFSRKPLNLANLKAALGKEAADDYFEFTPQVQLLIDADDNLQSVSIWADNVSVGGNDSLEGDIVIEDGRARGTAKTAKPGEFRDSTYSFDVSVDVDLLGAGSSRPTRPAGALAADSYKGLPVPEGHRGFQSEGSRFRTQASTAVVAEFHKVVEFYRGELSSGEWGEWKEIASDTTIETDSARLSFSGPTGHLVVQLSADGDEISITLVSRDAQAAKAAGLLASPGKARLLVANASNKAVAITINKREYTVAAGAGADDPKTGLNWEVATGNYTVVVKPPGRQLQSEKLTLGAEETWGVIIDQSGGFLASQLY